MMRHEAILKKTSVSGVAAGWFKTVRMGTFFSFLQKIFFFPKMDNIFLPKKKLSGKKKKNPASLLALEKDTRWTGNRSFF